MSFVIGVALGAFLMAMFLGTDVDDELKVEKCIFDGPPPEGYDSWSDWLESPHKKLAYLRGLEEWEYNKHVGERRD